MTEKSPWLVALTTANLLFLAAAAWLVRGRLEAIEDRLGDRAPPPRRAAAAAREGDGEERPAVPASEEERWAKLFDRLAKLADDVYEGNDRLAADVFEIRRTTKQVDAAVRRIKHQLTAPGTPSGEWNLVPLGTSMTPELLDTYRRDAASVGVRVLEGRVEVRGFLNMSPWTTMPIEYFVTRWPESGHETLLHVVGPAPVDEDLTADRLKGLVTGIYKGMVVAGFEQGVPSRFERSDPGDPKSPPRWVPPTGDTVYVGVRYELHGEVHLARATDWVVDPSTRTVLPEVAFRFTGSLRIDDFETGDEQVSAEAGGVVVSVFNDPNALVEVALPSAIENRYQYNHLRIPKPAVLRMSDGSRVDAVRDRARDAITVLAAVRDGRRTPLERAPTLVARSPDGASEVEVRFEKVAEGWRASHPSLAKGDWRLRVEGAEGPVLSQGFEPLYVDLVLSKTPIVPQGEGARPVESVELPGDLPAGSGKRPDAPGER